MGNEMGNNNTSGFQEESKTTAEAPEKSLQEAGHAADDVKAGNLENFTNSVSDDPKVGDNHVDNQKSGEGEQEAEILPPNNGKDKPLQKCLQQDDSNTTHSAESEQSHQKVENSASDDPKTAEDAHEEREQEETEAENYVASPTESKNCDEQVVRSSLDDPAKVGDAHADNLVLPERDQEEIEVPPPSISNAADSPKPSPKEVVRANNMKEEDHINRQTETKVYLEKEESNTTAEAQQKSLQEAGHADDVKAENHENFTNSASDDPKLGDNHADDQKSGEGEQEAEVLPPSNVTDKALQESLQQDDSNTTHSAESEQSHQKVENSVSDDPKAAEDAHEEKEQEETEAESHVAPPTESKGCDESTLDDPAEVGDVHADNLVLPERDQEEIEVHPPSITYAADSPKTSPKEDCINLQTETKIYLEKGLSLATDDSKEVGDAYVDNQMASSNAGSINCHKNRVSSSSDNPEVVGDAPVDDQNSGKGEQKQSQVHHPTNSNELEKSMEGFLHEGESNESNEEAMNLASDQPMQERNPSADSQTPEQETDGKPAESLKVDVESNGGNVGLEENHFGVKELLFEEQTSINTAGDEGTAQNPRRSGDLESHQHESPEVLAEPSTQSRSESPQESNNMLLQIYISNNQSGSVAPNLTPEMEEKRNVVLPTKEVSEFLSKTISLDTPKGAFGNCNEDLSTKINLERTDSSESLPEEKCMVLTEETKLVSKEPANQEIKNQHTLAQVGEEFLNDSMNKVSKTSEADSMVIESNQEANEELPEQFTDEIAAVTSQSPDNAASIIEPVLEMKLITRPARDLPPLAAKAAEIKIAGSGQCSRDEASRFSSGSSGAQSVGRSSTESNPEIHSQMRKSPSFSLDLLTEARAEETEQAEVRDVKPERSDSEKLRTPFQGFLKDEEGKNTVITPNAEENHIAMKPSTKEVMSSPAKAKSKRKPRLFLFGTCICCAAVIN